MSYLKDKLREMGASEAQVNSSTAKLIEKALIEDSDFCQKVAADAIERMAETIEGAKETAKQIELECKQREARAKLQSDALIRDIQNGISEFNEAKSRACNAIIDKDLSESVKAFRAVLEATKDVFGEEIEKHGSTDAMVAAINAASYIAWRGMPEQKEYKRLKPL